MARLNLIMTWDIRPGREQEYSTFINERLAPGLMEIGLSPVDVFYAIYGRVPQIMAILDVESEEVLRRALRSRRWAELKGELLQYIENYKERIIRADSGNYFA
jgi:hypothetical protein